MKKQIERVWWLCAVCTVIFSIVEQMHLDPARWTMGVFVFSFFGFLFSSVAWLFSSHLEYIESLKKKVGELEKQASGINSEKSEERQQS